MINMFMRSYRTSATDFITSRNLISHQGHYEDLFKTRLTSIFKTTFSTIPIQNSPKKNRYWLYLCGGVLTGACIQQGYAFYTEKNNEKNKTLTMRDGPVDTISSGKYDSSYYNPIPPHIVEKMIGKSYTDDCPIPITDLAYVRVKHYDMNGIIRTGELVVHKKIARLTMEIFKDIFDAKFPIEKMRLIDKYKANDELSMENNNSSAFCFRFKTDKREVSNHGLGIAIDINTRLNPFVKGTIVAPANGRKYIDRSLNEPGMIHPDSAVVIAFKKRGFSWGGDWKNLKDYQHFEIDREKLGIELT